MNHAISFIPEPRYIALLKRRRRTVWVVINACAVALGMTLSLAARAALLGDERVSPGAVTAAQAKLRAAQAERAAVLTELRAVEARLLAHAEATEHPDWSILLGYISRVGEGSVSLDGFVLEPADWDNVYLVGLTGQAMSQNDVTRFLLSLEGSGVFSATNLMRSGMTQNNTYAFAIVCRIGTPPPPEPPSEEDEQ